MSIEDDVARIVKELADLEDVNVRLALFGQPGAGKSSLINKITGQKLAEEGVSTDKTITANEYEWRGLHLVDLPGYGTSKFPKDTYFQDFKIDGFDLFLCVFDGKFRQADSQFFQQLKKIGKVCIFIRNKSDTIWQEGKKTEELQNEIQEDTQKQTESDQGVFFISCRTGYGLSDVSNAIFNHLDKAKQERWARSAKSHSKELLERKREAAEKIVNLQAALAAANGINPIPGVDVGVDLTIIYTMFKTIRDEYGLNDDTLQIYKMGVPAIAQLANSALKYASKEGILILLKRYAGRQTVKEVSKYIPFIGQAIAATLGFGITYQAGMSYLEDCHTLAQSILDIELQQQPDSTSFKNCV
jgi:GTP-binding protein EngB required for normal cell division/uncharacterized protein (DUF697 family)